MKSKAIICDLDGTLCDAEHRRKYLETKPKDYKNFYGKARLDKPNYAVYQLIVAMSRAVDIIYVSGRPDTYRELTQQWLKEWNCPDGKLFMRKEGDFRQDYVVKEEIFKNDLKDCDILFCIDDRKQVVDMWRGQGLTCFQCAEGNF